MNPDPRMARATELRDQLVAGLQALQFSVQTIPSARYKDGSIEPAREELVASAANINGQSISIAEPARYRDVDLVSAALVGAAARFILEDVLT